MADTPLYKRVNMQAVIANLPSSKRGGYVEDAVDVQLLQFGEEHNKLVNDYNELVQRDAAAVVDEEVGNQARELIASASRSAREFVENAREHAASIQAEAEADAEAKRHDIDAEVETKRNDVDAEVAAQREALAAEIAEARERLERETEALRTRNEQIRGETQALFTKIRGFYETQLGTLDEASTGILAELVAPVDADVDTTPGSALTVENAGTTTDPADLVAEDAAADEVDEPELTAVEDADIEISTKAPARV